MLLLITLLLAVVAATLIVKAMFWDDDYSVESLFGKIMWTVIGWPIAVICIGFVVGLILLPLPAELVDKNIEPSGSWDLRAISMGKNVQGQFFLGSGYIEGKAAYTYYYRSGDGLRVGDVWAEDVLVIEDSTQTPRIEENAEVLPWWIVPGYEWDYNYVIYIPEGSIQPMIDMDLPK